MESLTTAVLEPARWGDLVQVLAPVCGGEDGCWCYNHHIPPGAPDTTGLPARSAKYALLVEGRARGVLAYRGEDPVGWCAVDPHAALPGHDCHDPARPEVWVIHCFVVRPEARGQGVARALLGAAVELVEQVGAPALEAYPADPAQDRGASSASAGSPRLFEAAGFRREGDAPAPYLRYLRELGGA